VLKDVLFSMQVSLDLEAVLVVPYVLVLMDRDPSAQSDNHPKQLVEEVQIADVKEEIAEEEEVRMSRKHHDAVPESKVERSSKLSPKDSEHSQHEDLKRKESEEAPSKVETQVSRAYTEIEEGVVKLEFRNTLITALTVLHMLWFLE
jgi:hypothetical protein